MTVPLVLVNAARCSGAWASKSGHGFNARLRRAYPVANGGWGGQGQNHAVLACADPRTMVLLCAQCFRSSINQAAAKSVVARLSNIKEGT